MTERLIWLFIRHPEDVKSREGRVAYGRMAALCGLFCNVFLCLVKFFLGLTVHSVAVTADAVNNLSDAGSAVITLIGFTISGKPADRDHPFGHERMEAIASMAVSFLILALGVSLFRTSLGAFFRRETAEKSGLMIGVLLFSVALKWWMSRFYTTVGRTIRSSALLANAADSLFDCLSTGTVLISALLAFVTTFPADALCGLLVALFILKNGLGLLKETMDDLLGRRPDPALIEAIVTKLKSYEGAGGFHDLTVHSYGGNSCFATVHMEVSEHEDISLVHECMDAIERDFLTDLNIHLVIHADPVLTDNEEVCRLRDVSARAARAVDAAFHIHDFRMVQGKDGKTLLFDVVVPSSCTLSDQDIALRITQTLQDSMGAVHCTITVDRNYTMEQGE